MMPKLTAVILTRNEAQHIAACIESLRWADSILVFDSYSTDATAMLAQEAGATVVRHAFENYSTQRNAALDAAEDAEWVFFVDADERATPDLASEIRQVIAEREEAGWWVPRHNYIFGHRMRATGWWPVTSSVSSTAAMRLRPQPRVHEVRDPGRPRGYLEHPLLHYNYTTSNSSTKSSSGTLAYDASILLEKGIRPKAYSPLTHRQYGTSDGAFFTLQGWRDGGYGFLSPP
jgi:glycosyltransferase involved in cell wall biosynthesis